MFARAMNHTPHVAVVGGGAAGFFAALAAAEAFPHAQITLFEKNRTVLGKVRISGGGRCNVTNAAPTVAHLVKGYPRGDQFLRPLFRQFDNHATIRWFESRGLPLKTEPDGRVFPVSDQSADVIACLETEARRLGVKVRTSAGVARLSWREAVGSGRRSAWQLELQTGEVFEADRVIVTTGGNPHLAGYGWLAELGHAVVPPVPSLFTFNVPDSPLLQLAGVAVPEANVRLSGTKQSQTGAALLTHWGFSGPAVLRLSAWAARDLAERAYRFEAAFNWVFPKKNDEVLGILAETRAHHARKQVASLPLFGLPQRFWRALVTEAGLPESTRWAEAPAKAVNRLSELLVNGTFPVRGKTTFKDEFVTCGGVALSEVNPQTLESRRVPGLFFAGEVLDIDGITGGYNFQAAWTTGYVAGRACLA